MLTHLRALLIVIVFVLFTLPLMPVQWLLLRLNGKLARKLPQFYHRVVCRLLGIHIEIEGRLVGPGLIVANHASWLDIPVLSTLTPLSFIAKQEVGSWPFFGTLARLQASYFIDRSRRQTTGNARLEMIRRLRAGDSLVLFAEGTSGSGRGVKPFKTSLFGSVEDSEVQVLPVTVIYERQHGLPLSMRQRPQIAWYGGMDLMPHLWKVLRLGPINVRIIVAPALSPRNFKSRKALALACESHIRSELAKRLHPNTKIG